MDKDNPWTLMHEAMDRQRWTAAALANGAPVPLPCGHVLAPDGYSVGRVTSGFEVRCAPEGLAGPAYEVWVPVRLVVGVPLSV